MGLAGAPNPTRDPGDAVNLLLGKVQLCVMIAWYHVAVWQLRHISRDPQSDKQHTRECSVAHGLRHRSDEELRQHDKRY